MKDIVPELLEEILQEFNLEVKSSSVIKELTAQVETGEVNYDIANKYAKEIGNILSGVYKRKLSSDVLPDGKMYYNIAERVIGRSLEKGYSMVADVTESVQKFLNLNAGIGLKPVRPGLNQDRINGIINRISSEEEFEEIRWILDAPVRCFVQSIVDDSIKTNAEFHGKAGLKPKIIRKTVGNCCEWCSKIAGIYRYPDVPADVYRRHDNCDCTVNYDPGDGKEYQDIWTKKWKYNQEPDKIENRKLFGKNVRYKFGHMPPEEYERAVELWERYKEVDIPQAEKERIYEEFDNNLSDEERKQALVNRPIGNHYYTAVHKGHNQYKIIDKSLIYKPKDIVDEVLTEMFGEGWEELL